MRWLFFLLILFLHGDACVPGVPPPHADFEFRLPALHAELDPVEGGRIRDAHGREVLLRGVNVNAFVEYWQYDPNLFTTYPFTPEDVDIMAGIGWNAVRLLFSWSRMEPQPGVYDEAYLDQLEEAVQILESRGIYTIIDAHQDAWGPSLVAAADEVCTGSTEPAFGWDGAPAWATQDGGAARCVLNGVRELSPAVTAAFSAFWANAPGPGGVGIQTRYASMWEHVAERLSIYDSVAGYDVMNEPSSFAADAMSNLLPTFYQRTLDAVRAGEASAGAPRRLFFFEPLILWNDFLVGVPAPFGDDQMVYAPHIYQGGLNSVGLVEAIFQQAKAEAATFGGIPVVTGEWGSDPNRAADPNDDYFDRHLAFQDDYRFGYAWAVRDGDVGAVPVPAAVWLFGSGLIGLLGVARRKRAA